MNRLAKLGLLTGIALAGIAAATPSQALVLVASIDGQYGSPVGDTPNITIHNTTGFAFTNVQLSAQAYQGSNALLPVGTDVNKSDNSGGPFHLTQIKTLADIAGGSDFVYSFTDGPAACGPGNSNTGDLFAFDYDDTYGCTSSAQPGNSTITFTAQWDGQPIFAVFSPTTNATGTFIGFEGLDPTGNAESSFDGGGGAAGSSVGALGVLANIFVGTPPPVPEPATLALLGSAFAGLAAARRRRA